MATDLNKLYCAFNYVGDWRSMPPPDILNLKRELDRNFNIYSFLWSEQFTQAYERLINACFKTNRSPEMSAALRANLRRYRQAWGNKWQTSWEDMFVPEEQRLRRDEFDVLYTNLSIQLRKDVGLSVENHALAEHRKSLFRWGAKLSYKAKSIY